MAVLIKDMEVPNSCISGEGVCPILKADLCKVWPKMLDPDLQYKVSHGRLDNCPLDARENVRGEWIEKAKCYYECSECGGHCACVIYPTMNYSYCPYCGAKMKTNEGGKIER